MPGPRKQSFAKPKNAKGTFRRILKYFKPYRGQLVLVLIGLLGVDIFFWGVGFFLICLDYLSFETSEADFPGVFVYFLSNFTSSFVSSIFYTDTG